VDLLAVTAAAVALVAAPVNWWSRVASSGRAEAITKPLVTVALGLLAVAVADDVSTTAIAAATVGFALCLVGDVALLPAVDRFLVGLGAFALGHVAFVVMFAALGLDHLWLGLLALALAGVVVGAAGRSILRGAARRDRALRIPVACYLVVITVMAVAGWSTGRIAAIVGTTLFVASDSVLGWRMFVNERRWMAPVVMATYHGALTGLALSLAASSVAVAEASSTAASSTTSPGLSTTTSSTSTSTTVPASTSTSTSTTSTTTTSTSTSTSTSTTSTTTTSPPPAPELGQADFPELAAAVDRLARRNPTVAVSVWRGGAPVFRDAAGTQLDGAPVDGSTPFVIASLSKLVTALTVARLVELGAITTADPVPWAALDVPHHPAWDGVTVRELLDHTAGMPVDRNRWFVGSGTCRDQLAESMSSPPTGTRGTWRYSNGNYCALGLLVEHLTGRPLAEATRILVWDPVGVAGAQLVDSGAPPDMAPHPEGLARLERLGGAGAWLASSDDLAAMLSSVGPADLATMRYPAVMLDQYGWGHTGSVLDAVTCAWVLNDGTVVTAFVGGRSPQSGGGVCDVVLPALGRDLGLALGTPSRSPR
jgi:D-alanyl-D-alanine carboxypeptidase